MPTEAGRNALYRGAVWCCVVFVLALPAMASPILFLPVSFNVPRWLGAALGSLLSHPKCWASVATLVGVVGARRLSQSIVQASVVAILVLLAWLLGCDTADKMGSLF